MYQGIFWVVCAYGADGTPGLEQFDLLAFKVLCSPHGEVLDPGAALNAKSGRSFNHRAQWDQLPQKQTMRHTYQYYPRGRVELRRGKATIYLNPVIDRPDVIDRVRAEFGLDGEAVSVAVKADGSSHYHCRYDDGSIE